MEIKNSRKRLYLLLLLCIGLISASIVAFSFFFAENVVPSLQSADQSGVDSPYRSGINGPKTIGQGLDQVQNKLSNQGIRPIKIKTESDQQKFENLGPIRTRQSTDQAVRRSLV